MFGAAMLGVQREGVGYESMTVTDDTGNFGTLTTVAWREMNGVELDAVGLETVNANVATASTIAEALLDAINGALNLNWQTFSLDDLESGAGLGYLDALSRTQIQTPPANDTAQDWSSFITYALGSGPSANQQQDFNEWRRLADDLQQFSAANASRRSTADLAWGGVTHANGRWYVNGESVSLGDLYTAVRVNQLYNFDVSQSSIVEDLTENNKLIEAAGAWMALIRSKRPADMDSTASITFADRAQFITDWNIDPDTFTENTQINYDQQQASTEFDRWLNDIRSFVDKQDTDNQQLQIELARKSDRRDEVLQATVSFSKSESKTGRLIAGNLG